MTDKPDTGGPTIAGVVWHILEEWIKMKNVDQKNDI